MKHIPPIWLIILISGLPVFSETIYTPSLPHITETLHTSPALAEYSVTIYLIGFAAGTFFWGWMSDRLGRKPCLLTGLLVYTAGCLIGYASPNIFSLYIGRLLQAFGVSIGGVLIQTICRDAFQGDQLSRVYSQVSALLASFSSTGPLIGGLITEYSHWYNLFLLLMAFGLLLMLLIPFYMPETNTQLDTKRPSLKQVALNLLRDRRVMGFGLIVGLCDGLLFSYTIEAPFCLINLLGLTPSQYGISLSITAASGLVGGAWSAYLNRYWHAEQIISLGLRIMISAGSLFSALIFASLFLSGFSFAWAVLIVGLQMIIAVGVCMVVANIMALALAEHQAYIGTAASLFGLFYYAITALCTWGMGTLHNGTLLPMPLYITALISVSGILYKFVIRPSSPRH